MSLTDDLAAMTAAMNAFSAALDTALGDRSETLPGLQIELGNSNQANGGNGIDNGTYYQIDMSIGQTLYNGLTIETQPDGSAILPQGIYAVFGGGKIITQASDTFPAPIQITLATGSTSYPFPGVYQDAVQSYPDALITDSARPTDVTGTLLGMRQLTGTLTSNGVESTWLAFTKLAGADSNIASLQGYITFLKIG